MEPFKNNSAMCDRRTRNSESYSSKEQTLSSSGSSIAKWMAIIIATIVSVFAILHVKFPDESIKEPIYWDWGNINTSETCFPKDFLWGTATAAHQVEGHNYNNQWWEFENSNQSRIRNGDVSGITTNHWDLYKNDIELMKKDLHVNSYRFSIEWSKIETAPGVYNRTAIEHYHAVIDELLANKIEPLITLHHFTDPIWFSRMGAFEREENIDYFVSFAKFAFQEFSSKVSRWCTINEPNVYATEGYIMGHFPPAKRDLKLALKVIKNMAEAHVRVYETIKKLPHGRESQIGIVLQLSQVHPYSTSNVIDRMIAHIATSVSPGLHLDFFTTGVMSMYIPFYANLHFENKKAPYSNDFIGLNYYTHDVIHFKIAIPPYSIVKNPNIHYTEMNWEMFPEGIYHAIKTITKRFGPKIPIIITENGIADGSDLYRREFFEKYLYAVSRAIKEGHNVQGYIVWSLLDNFEWASGFTPRFGLYEVNYSTFRRTLREGAKAFVNTVKTWKKQWYTK